MADKVKTGTVLIEEGVTFPDSFQLQSEPYSNGWRLVKDLDGYGLDRRVSEAGWTSFYMAGEMKASAFALDGEKSLRRAVNQILANLKSERFNSLEITHVTRKCFLGLSRTTVSAHPRHIQKSIFLFDWKTRQQGHHVPGSRKEKAALFESRPS